MEGGRGGGADGRWSQAITSFQGEALEDMMEVGRCGKGGMELEMLQAPDAMSINPQCKAMPSDVVPPQADLCA
jgi:hypothetical protein